MWDSGKPSVTLARIPRGGLIRFDSDEVLLGVWQAFSIQEHLGLVDSFLSKFTIWKVEFPVGEGSFPLGMKFPVEKVGIITWL